MDKKQKSNNKYAITVLRIRCNSHLKSCINWRASSRITKIKGFLKKYDWE